MIGRIISGTLKNVSPRTQLAASAILATILTFIAILFIICGCLFQLDCVTL